MRSAHRHTPDEFAVLVDAAKAKAVAARQEMFLAFWNDMLAQIRRLLSLSRSRERVGVRVVAR